MNFIKSIIDGMTEAIIAEFGSEYRVYTEAVRQGLKAPCFFISCKETAEEEKLTSVGKYKGRFLRRQVMEVLYFPKDEDFKAEYNDVTDRLYNILYYITADGELIRGTGLKSETVNGVLLSFSVTYEFFVYRYDDDDRTVMDNLSLTAK